MTRVVILGAGHAGVALADNLRRKRFQGSIVLVGDEQGFPYQRPPLSKEVLSGTSVEPTLLRPASFYEKGIEFLHDRAFAIDPQARRVSLQSGRTFPYERLVLATGARPRALPVPGANLANVFSLRSFGDALALSAAMTNASRIAVIGAGYVGLEVAAAAAKRGLDVVVIERADRVLPRSASEPFARYVERLHRDKGVQFRLGSTVVGFVGDGRVTGLQLDDGSSIACDCSVIGIGVEPNVEIAQAAGLACSNGLLVDEKGITSDPAILAMGDCAAFFNTRYGRHLRLESIGAAQAHARILALTIVGETSAFNDIPWFWSDQFGCRLQIAGVANACDQSLVKGDPATRRFSILHLKGGALSAVECCDDPETYIHSRRAIETGDSGQKVVTSARES